LEEAFTADAVLIASPTPTHADYIERAASAGRAIFCEKPIDLSAERVRACLHVVQRSGVALMVGFNRRFDPHFLTLKRRLDAGEIGALELLTIISRDPAPPPPAYVATSGGLFRDMMIHDLDMARFLLGEEPQDVHAAASCLVDAAMGATGDIDTAVVTLRTASGKLCQISNSRRATYGYDQRIEVHGAKGLLRAGNVTATTVELANAGGFVSDPVLPFFLERYAAAYRAELDAFIAAVTHGAAPLPNGDDGLRALLLADAATESARTGAAIRLT
jgi:myo-inositol 2-dehydrogenase/D-chiro-inositol 1-dehydrogenase